MAEKVENEPIMTPRGASYSSFGMKVAEKGIPPMELVKPGWRTVEVATSFQGTGIQGGGGFLIRESSSKRHALHAEGLPVQGKSALFVEAFTLRQAIVKTFSCATNIATPGVVFLFESPELLECLSMPHFPPDEAGVEIRYCRDILETTTGEKMGYMHLPLGELPAAKWIAERGRVRHLCFDYRVPLHLWPTGLVRLLDQRGSENGIPGLHQKDVSSIDGINK